MGMDKTVVIFCPEIREKASKVGTYDDTVQIMDWDFVVTDLVHKIKGGRSGEERLFTPTAPDYKASFEKATIKVGLKAEKLSSYQLRHGGASRARLLNRLTLMEAKRRGRWMSDSSVRRYDKGGRVQQALNRSPKALLARLAELRKKLHALLLGSL